MSGDVRRRSKFYIGMKASSIIWPYNAVILIQGPYHSFRPTLSSLHKDNSHIEMAVPHRAQWALCSLKVLRARGAHILRRNTPHSTSPHSRWISQGEPRPRPHAALSFDRVQAEYAKRNNSTLYASSTLLTQQESDSTQ
jgi:hypothetical protein